MGTVIDEAIVVTGYNERLDDAYLIAQELFYDELLTEIIEGLANGSRSFFIASDGSKEGWGTHEDASKRRRQFMSRVRDITGVDAVMIEYGETTPKVIVER